MPELMFYHRPSCPYCGKVRAYMQSENIAVPERDISANPDYVQELINTGGKKQVPCLVIDGQALYESDDIIQWFKDNKHKLNEN
ncbi:MAG: glutathione S-transferase N-terminal domain-containing protein [Candidatus Omnitrophica bacterium]|nr:glutathione S-transferase N-terminal domain-containing protein [Candidatus Omnitrophota bacterium]